ncbi:hypothetical protein PWT90_00271 [Aphanocladium album]|nr:hypothetical protein PWT90_00271 [Aphanocladium album]
MIKSISIISAPFHGGTAAVGPGRGPLALQQLASALHHHNLPIHNHVIVRDFTGHDGEIARIFALYRHISQLVADARAQSSFPIVLAGNCNAAVGVWAGLATTTTGCVWFDAHDDFHTPETIASGYGDSMAVAMLAGRCYRRMLRSVEGFVPMDLERLVHVGMRDVTDEERDLVTEAGFDIIWGSTEKNVDFASELDGVLGRKKLQRTMVHVDLDCLDASVGKANKLASYGGLLEDDLAKSLDNVVKQVQPVSLTLASYDPEFDTDGTVARTAIRCVDAFIQQLLRKERKFF